MQRLISTIIAVMVSTNLIAAPIQKGLMPFQCVDSDPCTCFTQPAMDIIAKGLENYQLCNIEREELKAFISRKHDARQDLNWYQEPQWIIGGVVVSFGFGAVLAWSLTK